MPHVSIERAGAERAKELIRFLEQPEIDRSFVPPLSQRRINIAQRVDSKFEHGFWLVARNDAGSIIGCRGCNGMVDPILQIVEFSTSVVSPAGRGHGLGRKLISNGVELARGLYNPRQMRLDSWEGNDVLAALMKSLGFRVSRIYPDPGKRPPGVRSVEYVLDCRP